METWFFKEASEMAIIEDYSNLLSVGPLMGWNLVVRSQR